jgi:hypothetical protein
MIETNIKYLIEKLGEHYSDNIDINRMSLLKIVQINTDLAQGLYDAKIKMEPWEYYFEELIEKIIHAPLSIIKLSEGYTFNTYKEKVNIKMVDSSSMFDKTIKEELNVDAIEYLCNNA